MASGLDLARATDAQIIEVVNQDFLDSAADRRQVNWQNYLREKTFQGIDISQPFMPQVGDNNLGLDLPTTPSGPSEPASPVRNKIYLPIARSLILTAKAMICGGIWPNNTDFFSVEAQRREEQDSAEKFRQYAHFDMRRGGYQDEAELAVEKSLIYDFQLFMVDWREDYAWVPKFLDVYRRAVNDAGESMIVGKPVGRKAQYEWKQGSSAGVFFHAPSTFNVRHDPMAIHGPIGPSTCEWVGMEYKMSWRRLLDMAKSGVLRVTPVTKAHSEGTSEQTIETDFDAMIRADMKLQSERTNREINPGQKEGEKASHPLVQERWDNTSHVAVVNRKWVVRRDRSVGIPFVKLLTYPAHGQFGGTPMIQDLMHIQIDINLMARLRRDAQNLGVNKTMIVDGNAFRSQESIDRISLNPLEVIIGYPQPGRTISDAIHWIDPPGPGSETINEQMNEMQFAERAIGVDATSQGVISPTGRRTATEHELAAGGSQRRGGFNARALERAIVASVAQKMLVLYNLHLTDEKKFRVLGPSGMEWRSVTAEDMFFGELPDVIPTGLSGEQSRALELDLFMRGVEKIQLVPEWKAITEQEELLREMYNRLRVVNPGRFIKSQSLAGSDIPQKFENILMASGHYVTPLPSQPHDQHIAELQQYTQGADFTALPESTQSLFLRHIKEHQMMQTAASAPQAPPPGAGMGPGPIMGGPGRPATPASLSEMLAQSNRRMAPPTGQPVGA